MASQRSLLGCGMNEHFLVKTAICQFDGSWRESIDARIQVELSSCLGGPTPRKCFVSAQLKMSSLVEVSDIFEKLRSFTVLSVSKCSVFVRKDGHSAFRYLLQQEARRLPPDKFHVVRYLFKKTHAFRNQFFNFEESVGYQCAHDSACLCTVRVTGSSLVTAGSSFLIKLSNVGENDLSLEDFFFWITENWKMKDGVVCRNNGEVNQTNVLLRYTMSNVEVNFDQLFNPPFFQSLLMNYDRAKRFYCSLYEEVADESSSKVRLNDRLFSCEVYQREVRSMRISPSVLNYYLRIERDCSTLNLTNIQNDILRSACNFLKSYFNFDSRKAFFLPLVVSGVDSFQTLNGVFFCPVLDSVDMFQTCLMEIRCDVLEEGEIIQLGSVSVSTIPRICNISLLKVAMCDSCCLLTIGFWQKEEVVSLDLDDRFVLNLSLVLPYECLTSELKEAILSSRLDLRWRQLFEFVSQERWRWLNISDPDGMRYAALGLFDRQSIVQLDVNQRFFFLNRLVLLGYVVSLRQNENLSITRLLTGYLADCRDPRDVMRDVAVYVRDSPPSYRETFLYRFFPYEVKKGRWILCSEVKKRRWT
jgi:PIN domain nuclease of toxin-antitoxin system